MPTTPSRLQRSRSRRLAAVSLLAVLALTLGSARSFADQIVARVQIGLSPIDVVVGRLGDAVYVVNAGGFNSGNVTRMAGGVLTPLNLPGGLSRLAIRPQVPPDGPPIVPQDRLYVISDQGAQDSLEVVGVPPVRPFQRLGSVPVGNGPVDVIFDPSGLHAYVTCADDRSVQVVDVSAGPLGLGAVVRTISLGTAIPRGLTVADVPGAGVRLYVATVDQLLRRVAVIDPAAPDPNAVVAWITVPGAPLFLAATPDGTEVFVTLENHRTSVLGTLQNALLATVVNSGLAPKEVAVVATPDGLRAYVADHGGPSSTAWAVTRIDVASRALLPPILNVDKLPFGIAGSPDGERVYVTSGFHRLDVIDTTLP